MKLHLVGETIDAASAHRKAREGELISVFRGVYLDGQEDPDAVLREYAVRIAHYLYPAAYLCSASAVDLRPTADGRLFICGRRNQRTRLRGLEIVQTQAPPHPSIGKAIIGDRTGEFTMNASSPEQRLLEAFRMWSEQANALTEDMRRAIAERLIANMAPLTPCGSLRGAMTGFAKAKARNAICVQVRIRLSPLRTAPLSHLDVAWHGDAMGQLSHDGHEWRWLASKGPIPR